MALFSSSECYWSVFGNADHDGEADEANISADEKVANEHINEIKHDRWLTDCQTCF